MPLSYNLQGSLSFLFFIFYFILFFLRVELYFVHMGLCFGRWQFFSFNFLWDLIGILGWTVCLRRL